ncbi:hypothetical protein VCHC41A1_3592, partial [Vibrio cholerae HC-41A1]
MIKLHHRDDFRCRFFKPVLIGSP